MESMDADCYVIEYAIRDRLLDARATARAAALLRQADELRRSKSTERVAKPPQAPRPARRNS